ncbi:MAG: HEPN domain-containing protein [Terriglobia bacterium]
MADETTLARGWFVKAESDLEDAKRTLVSNGPYDTACFHAQQAAEKYIKGFLALHGLIPPRIHNLEEPEMAA